MAKKRWQKRGDKKEVPEKRQMGVRTFSRKTTTSTAKITRTPRAVHFLRTGRTDKKPHVVSLNSPPLHQMQHTLALGCSMRTGGTPHGAGANSLRSDPMVEKNGSSTSSNVLSRKISNCSISFQRFLLYGVNVENQRICFLQKRPLWPFFPDLFQDFSRSTRFTFLCTAQTSKFQEKTRPKFCRNETFSFSFSFSFQQKSMNFVIFLLNFDEILSEFHEKFQEITKVLNILRNSARKIRKMLEISGICEKFHFFE